MVGFFDPAFFDPVIFDTGYVEPTPEPTEFVKQGIPLNQYKAHRSLNELRYGYRR